jgi:neutral trehalase
LAEIARALGKEDDADTFTTWSVQTRRALNENLWDDSRGTYYSFDLREGRHLRVNTVASFLPFFAHVPDEERAERLLVHLRSPDEFYLAFPVASTSRCEAAFAPDNYWRGPSWVMINWFVTRGLEQYRGPYGDFARHLRRGTLELVEKAGFWEYFNPITGEGRGEKGYSWTAALAIDLISDAG